MAQQDPVDDQGSSSAEEEEPSAGLAAQDTAPAGDKDSQDTEQSLGTQALDVTRPRSTCQDTAVLRRPEHLRTLEVLSVLLQGSRVWKLLIRNPFFLFPTTVVQLPRLQQQFLCEVSVRLRVPSLALEPAAGSLEKPAGSGTSTGVRYLLSDVDEASMADRLVRGCEEEQGGLACREEPSSWSGGFTRAEDTTRPGGPDRLETPARREVVSWLGGRGQRTAGRPSCVEQAVADAAAEDSEDEERALDRLLLACEDRRRTSSRRSRARRAAATPVVVERAIGDNMASTFLFGLRVVDFGPARPLDIPHSAVTRAPRLERSRHIPCRTPHRVREAWTWSSQAREEAELRRLRINTFRQAIENLRHRHRRAPPPGLLRARDSLEVMLARSRRTDADDESSEEDRPPARRRRYSRDRPDRPGHSDSDRSDSTGEQQVVVRPPSLLGTPGSVSKCSSDREDDSDDDPPASTTVAPVFLPLRVTKYRTHEDLSGSSKPIRKKAKIQFGKRMHARKRKLATSHVQITSLSANVGRSNSDSPQECTEIKPEPTNSETSDGKSVEMTNNESSFDSLSGVVSKTESTTVNWPSDRENEEKADERITELSSEHEIVQVLYKDIPRELSVKSVTTESEGNPSTASLEAQIPVLSVGAIECHSVSGKVDINRQAKQGTSESASDLVAAGSCDKEALGHPEQRDVPRRAKRGAKCQDQDTVVFMWPSYVMIRMTKSSVKVHTSVDPGGSAEHLIIRNPECVVVKSPQSSTRVGRRSTEAIYVNSRTDSRAGATDTDDEDTAPRVSRHPRPEA